MKKIKSRKSEPHPASKYFRILATEFHEIPNEEVNIWIQMTEPLVAPKYFRGMYSQALALLTAHRLKMKKSAHDESDDIFPVSKISEDGGSTAFAINQANATDDELYLTWYGKQYVAIRDRMFAGAIV
ncbi:MAG: DUF4054 domain-containing protein [Defluviitaleaceae bacterium]|nr:DUF4054 domain-containing protein [Defluviitaleaceae bacterium]